MNITEKACLKSGSLHRVVNLDQETHYRRQETWDMTRDDQWPVERSWPDLTWPELRYLRSGDDELRYLRWWRHSEHQWWHNSADILSWPHSYIFMLRANLMLCHQLKLSFESVFLPHSEHLASHWHILLIMFMLMTGPGQCLIISMRWSSSWSWHMCVTDAHVIGRCDQGLLSVFYFLTHVTHDCRSTWSVASSARCRYQCHWSTHPVITSS